MKMPGGGFFKVGPGQITDDSEMAMSQMWALIAQGDIETNLAIFYKRWYESRPFDVGNNTRATIGALSKIDASDKLIA